MYLENYAADFPGALTRLSHSFDNPNWSYQYHLHQNETELVYIDGGAGTYYINNASYPLHPGIILIVERGALHSLVSDPENAISCRTCAISSTGDASSDNTSCSHTFHSDTCALFRSDGYLLQPDVSPCMNAGDQEPLIKDLFLELERCRADKTPAVRLHCNRIAGALASVYADLFRRFPKVEYPKETTSARDILLYMNEHFTEKITLEGLSREFFISADSISHSFAKAYGISPINYVIDRRMNDAKWMLINTADSIPAISRQVGYENTSHFCKLFEKRVGYSPKEFRRRYISSSV